ncbi:MAG: DUF456 domain-containing protein [Chitinophagales bacterium]|nr:DUF456 domain-containing protein [Chitinophagales bacterium]
MEAIIGAIGIWGLVIIGIILIIIAFAGSVLPTLPGTPFASLAVFLIHFSLPLKEKFSWYTLSFVIFITIAISAVDYILPIWGTKKYGGSKAGIRGSTIGLIIGAFLSFFTAGIGIVALVAGPFLGAYVGERYFAKVDKKIALQSAWGSLVGFLAGTLAKVIVVCILSIIFLVGLIRLL